MTQNKTFVVRVNVRALKEQRPERVWLLMGLLLVDALRAYSGDHTLGDAFLATAGLVPDAGVLVRDLLVGYDKGVGDGFLLRYLRARRIPLDIGVRPRRSWPAAARPTTDDVRPPR